jgi:CRP/FNR family transcriptional regulator, cyclic AMP receptor protein
MERKGKLPFDPKVFLSKVNGGRAIHDYRKDKIVFRQGDPADAVFYIQKGKIKLTVVSERGKEAVVGILEPSTTLADLLTLLFLADPGSAVRTSLRT